LAEIRLHREAREGGLIGHVTIDNVARLNTLNRALMAEFVAVFAQLAAEPALRAVVLRGAGARAFIGGADIDEMAALDAGTARGFITALHRCCAAVRDLPVPVIARIEGYALGGGMELAAACDLRVAAEGAVFGMPEVRLGIPSVIEAALLPALVGWGRAREMLLLGDTFSATDAAACGLVQRVVPAAGLDAVVEAWLASILRNGAAAMRAQKRLLRAWEDLPLSAAIEAGIESFAAAFEGSEAPAMLAAFRASRR
jgi:enoyl-CoA hydratase/carnithine racemase